MKKTILAMILLATISTNMSYVVAMPTGGNADSSDDADDGAEALLVLLKGGDSPADDDLFEKALSGKSDVTPSWWKEKATELGQAAGRFAMSHPEATIRAAIAAGIVVSGLAIFASYKIGHRFLVSAPLPEMVYKKLQPAAASDGLISRAREALRAGSGGGTTDPFEYKNLSW